MLLLALTWDQVPGRRKALCFSRERGGDLTNLNYRYLAGATQGVHSVPAVVGAS